jgi:2-polyprenyl-3-methyl-5-hydroxy-6-metoxy-1,4-benzoquinol methylase
VIFLSPLPDDLVRYYSSEYRRLPDPDAFRRAVADESYKLRLLPPRHIGARLVDVGSGVGGFCVAAQAAGYDVVGLEIDRALVAFLRDQGVEAHYVSAGLSGLANLSSADVVTAWHVIEHVSQPGRLLREIASALAPGGVAVISTPNPLALQHRVLRTRWPHVDAPRHLTLLPQRTLVAYAAGMGLRCRSIVTTDAGGLAWNAFGWDEAIRDPEAQGIEARVRYWLAELAKSALGPVERRGQRGSTYTVVFEKPADAKI